MPPIRFRIRTIMIVICVLAILLVAIRIWADFEGISGMSVGLDAWNLPALFVHVTRPTTLYSGPTTLRFVQIYSLRDLVVSLAAALAGPTARSACARAVRMRRAKLDRQFAMQEHANSDVRGLIAGLAQFTGPNTTPTADQSGASKRV
jgi:hypothetical protein